MFEILFVIRACCSTENHDSGAAQQLLSGFLYDQKWQDLMTGPELCHNDMHGEVVLTVQ